MVSAPLNHSLGYTHSVYPQLVGVVDLGSQSNVGPENFGLLGREKEVLVGHNF